VALIRHFQDRMFVPDRRSMGIIINLRHERFAQALAQGKTATESYALAGYKANDGNASRLKGNERISARVQEIVGRAADRPEVSLERVLRELKAMAFSNISKAVTWGPSVQVREEEEDGQRVKVIVSAVCWSRATSSTRTRPPRSRQCRRAPLARFASGCTTSCQLLWPWVSTSECSTSARRTLTPFMPSRTRR
jgi:hypothetical protein